MGHVLIFKGYRELGLAFDYEIIYSFGRKMLLIEIPTTKYVVSFQ